MNRVLLARAFPWGSLDVRGVLTIGGWTAVDAPGHPERRTAPLIQPPAPDRIWWLPPWRAPARDGGPPWTPQEPGAPHVVEARGYGDLLPDYRDPFTRQAIWRALGRLLQINDADNGVLLQTVAGGRIVSLTTLHASDSFDNDDWPDDLGEEDAVLMLLAARRLETP